MSKQINIIINKVAIYKLLAFQLVLTVVIAGLLSVLINKIAGYSALIGGLAYSLPNAFFYRFALRGSNEQTPGNIFRWFYLGEAGKLIFTGLFFAACFAWIKPLHIVSLFLTFLIMIIINLVGLALIGTDN